MVFTHIFDSSARITILQPPTEDDAFCYGCDESDLSGEVRVYMPDELIAL